MESKSNDILILLIFTAFWFYQLYKIWFQIDQEYEKALKRAKWMPKIFNTEREFIKDKQAWIMLARVSSIVLITIIIFINITLLPSLLFGR